MCHCLFLIRTFRFDRVEIGDDVFACVVAEFSDALVGFLAVALDLDQERIAPAQHVFDDAGRPDHLLGIVPVEHQLGVAGADVQNAYGSHGQNNLSLSGGGGSGRGSLFTSWVRSNAFGMSSASLNGLRSAA